MRMGIGLGVGINRSNYAQGIFGAYATRVVADGGVVEGGACVDAVSGLLLNASLLLIPSGYKGGKLYAEIPTNGNGDLTWTRGSDAFRTNASGLIQRVPWNLVTWSEDFSNSAWITTNATISANSTIAPNSTLTADSLVENTSNAIHRISNSATGLLSVLGSTTYTFSVYAKNNGRRYLYVNAGTAISAQSTFDLESGVISATALGTASITNVGDGWYRCSVTGTAITTRSTSAFFQLNDSGVASDTTYTGNGTSGIFIWGAQLVEGTTAQTYLPTTDRLNFPRLDYTYGSCPSVLLEPQRTNLMLNSGDFQNASWGKSTLTFNSTETAPDGTSSARNYSTAGAFSYAIQTVPVTSGQYYTSSVFLKYTSGVGSIAIRYTDGTSVNFISVTANLINGTIGSVSYGGNGANGSATITALTNGWYRVTVSGTLTIANAGFIVSNLGLGATTFSIWGGQVELGAYPTTYIPTTSATATRVADSFSRNNIYTNGLITSSGGTWFVELRGNVAYTRDASINSLFIADTNLGSTNGFVFRNQGAANSRLFLAKRVAGAETTIYQTTTDTAKIAIKWNGTICDVFANGTKVTSASSFTTTLMEFLIANGNDVPKFIQQMALYPSPLSDTDCTTLTTL